MKLAVSPCAWAVGRLKELETKSTFILGYCPVQGASPCRCSTNVFRMELNWAEGTKDSAWVRQVNVSETASLVEPLRGGGITSRVPGHTVRQVAWEWGSSPSPQRKRGPWAVRRHTSPFQCLVSPSPPSFTTRRRRSCSAFSYLLLIGLFLILRGTRSLDSLGNKMESPALFFKEFVGAIKDDLQFLPLGGSFSGRWGMAC